MAKYNITRIYIVNGDRSDPIEVNKVIMNDAHLKTYRSRLQNVLSKRYKHPVIVHFEFKTL